MESQQQKGLTPDSVLRYLAKFHDVLPLSPELHHDQRVEMIESAFDKVSLSLSLSLSLSRTYALTHSLTHSLTH